MSTMIPLIEAVTRREIAGLRGLSLGIVTSVPDKVGPSDRPSADVRLHGTELVLQRVPVAVGRIGVAALPRPGDLVVVGFLDGDLNGPVVLASLYDDQQEPPEAAADEVVYAVPDPGGDAARLELRLPNGSTLVVRDSEARIEMGSTSIVVETDGNITVEAAADLTLKAGGALNLEAATNVTVKGLGVKVEASAQLELKGAINTIAGTTNFSAA